MSANQQAGGYGICIKYGNPCIYSIVKVKSVWNTEGDLGSNTRVNYFESIVVSQKTVYTKRRK